jgi:hypothetical protein
VVLKLYADRQFVAARARHVVMLYPFWGEIADATSELRGHRFQHYVETGSSLFTMTELADADLAILPMPWEDVLHDDRAQRLAASFIQQARAAAKPVAVFFTHDSAAPVELEDAFILRTSLYRSRKRPSEFAIPSWTEDLLAEYTGPDSQPRSKQSTPVVGFCGYGGPLGPQGLRGRLRRPLTYWSKRIRQSIGHALGVRAPFEARTRALGALSRSQSVATNFVFRDRYLGPQAVRQATSDGEIAHQIRDEFVTNLMASDYVLCARGGGNYSRRLYETLACGRIPIFINTDCVLPYDFEIDWKKFCVWVEPENIEDIGDIVADFHRSLSPEGFLALQQQCRSVWKNRLSPEGFFSNFERLPFTRLGAGVQTMYGSAGS